jgi:hypothetical protein
MPPPAFGRSLKMTGSARSEWDRQSRLSRSSRCADPVARRCTGDSVRDSRRSSYD